MGITLGWKGGAEIERKRVVRHSLDIYPINWFELSNWGLGNGPIHSYTCAYYIHINTNLYN